MSISHHFFLLGNVQQVEDLIPALSADEHYTDWTFSQPKCSKDPLAGVQTVRVPDKTTS